LLAVVQFVVASVDTDRVLDEEVREAVVVDVVVRDFQAVVVAVGGEDAGPGVVVDRVVAEGQVVGLALDRDPARVVVGEACVVVRDLEVGDRDVFGALGDRDAVGVAEQASVEGGAVFAEEFDPVLVDNDVLAVGGLADDDRGVGVGVVDGVLDALASGDVAALVVEGLSVWDGDQGGRQEQADSKNEP
jgi:hypothetical protein